MSERRYTELFFLDEATAVSAGHRPCAECRRDRFNAFKEAWRRARGLDSLPFADEMDRVLHPARIHRGKK
jgi:methylphosphotriester-DNA--protein-cysteine methyltransferase